MLKLFVSFLVVGMLWQTDAAIEGLTTGVKPTRAPPNCGNVVCAEDTHCEMWTRPCLIAPCPRYPVCLPGTRPPLPDCSSVKCGEGESCEMWSSPCRNPPCSRFPVCIRPKV